MPLRLFRREEKEQLSHFEKGRIIGMMEAWWSARKIACQLDRSDCVVGRCGTQWICGYKRCHLHEDQAQDTLDRLVIKKTITSEEIHEYMLHRPPSRHRPSLH
ncbi:uncharacterized protein TNCV_4589951 [Trichonephila clavipes]|nr:uncharacterized protein TNCV_4589951 [Trichonephila clavipes]